jgi:RNA polymerase sigma-70 factor (ECF subfamily)
LETSELGHPVADSLASRPDALALDAFVRDHYQRLVRLARLVCRDPAEASDAVQSALERAWRQRETLRDPAALRSWLDRIVVREAIRIDRRARSPFRRLLAGDRVTAIEDRRAGQDARSFDLQRAFEALPAEQRAAIVLHLHHGYSIAETAAIVGAPAETVRSRLRLGKERLRAALGDPSP